MLCQKSKGNDSSISGHRLLAGVTRFHSPKRSQDAADEIYQYLVHGEIVILDLSVGDATIRERLGKDVASRLFHQNMQAFTEGRVPPNVVIYVEEAHILIGKNADLTETWPRIAKEGGKCSEGFLVRRDLAGECTDTALYARPGASNAPHPCSTNLCIEW